MDAEEIRKKLERDILAIIEDRLKNGKMDAQRAKGIAKLVLDKLGHHLTMEQIYEIVPKLDDRFIELAQAILPLMREHDNEIRKVVSEHAQKLINDGKIDEAHDVLMQNSIKTNK